MKYVRSTIVAVMLLTMQTSARSEEEIDAPANTKKTKFSVKKGDKIKITASGNWKMGDFIGSCGPGGFASGQHAKYNITSIANHGALIARIQGNDEDDVSVWYNVGTERTITADRDGFLVFSPNDNEQGNNGGSLRVTIKINER